MQDSVMKQWERDRHWQHIGNTYQNVSYIQTLFVFKEEQDFLWDLKEEKKRELVNHILIVGKVLRSGEF